MQSQGMSQDLWGTGTLHLRAADRYTNFEKGDKQDDYSRSHNSLVIVRRTGLCHRVVARPLKIAASASASRSSSAKPKVWIGWLRGWRYGLRCY